MVVNLSTATEGSAVFKSVNHNHKTKWICEQIDTNKADSTSKKFKEADILYFSSDRARPSA